MSTIVPLLSSNSDEREPTLVERVTSDAVETERDFANDRISAGEYMKRMLFLASILAGAGMLMGYVGFGLTPVDMVSRFIITPLTGGQAPSAALASLGF